MTLFNPDIHRVALIAGNGALPAEIKLEMDRLGQNPLLIGINGEIDPDLAKMAREVLTFGQIGSLFEILKKEGIRHVVFAGGINKRPDFKDIKMDLLTLKDVPIFLKIVMGGDNSVLSKVAAYFAKKDVSVVGAHEVVPGLLAGKGVICGKPSLRTIMPTVKKAYNAAKMIGGMDIGQAAIGEDERIIALEAAEGTDAMIKRVRELRPTGRISKKPSISVLVKAMKPEQDMRADLPTIGPHTVMSAAEAGLKGIVIEAGKSFILQKDETLRRAKDAKMFILGVNDADLAP